MTPQEIRIAVAEECGYKLYYEKGNAPWTDNPEWYSPDGKFCVLGDIPNYPFDLNAMREAWDSLTWQEDEKFCKELHKIVCPECCTGPVFECSYTINATALQRAEAFLRVKGKWRE